jgi:CHAT domain-containing protein
VNYFEVVMLPSVSVVAELRRKQPAQSKSAPANSVIVVADPVFDKSDERVRRRPIANTNGNSKTNAGSHSAVSSQPAGSASPLVAATRIDNITDSSGRIARLPFTRREASDILALLPSAGGMAVLDFKASRATVAGGLLAQYRIVHFATHGLTNDEHPELSGLLLSMVDEEGQTEDGFLQLHEIYNLNLPVDMVVLSACETGLGKKVRGEGLIGLTRGFMYAGAKRVVSSLWQVNDASTSKLMKYFYQAMLKDGMPPAAALRAAQLEMLKQPERQPPYYWAAFELQGDWQIQP